MFRKVAVFAVKFRILIITLFLGITVVMGVRLRRLEFDPNIKSMLPDNIDARDRLNQIEEIFGGTEFIQIALVSEDILEPESLKRVKNITKSIERVNGVEKVLSISNMNTIKGRDGDLIVKKLIKRIPKSKEQIEQLRLDIIENETIYGMLISKDFTATVILAFIEDGTDDAELLKELHNILNENPGDEQVYTGGLPVIRGELARHMQNDLKKFLPLGIFIMLVFLFLCFRELRGILLPFIIVVMSIIVSMGFITILGWKIQLVTIILPVILIAVANDYGIHLMARYQYEVKQLNESELNKESKRNIIQKIVVSLGGPVSAAGLTTIAGFMTLLSHIVSPAKQLGVLAGIGILFSLAGSILFIPAVLSLLPISIYSERQKKNGIIDSILNSACNIVTAKPRKVIVISGLIVFILIPGIFFLKIDTDPISYFNPDSHIVKSENILTEKFGGSTNISVVANGDILSPSVMKEIDELEEVLSNRPNIGDTTSIAGILRQMNYVLHDNNPDYKIIPETREAIAQYFLLYSMNGDPDDFEKMVDFEYTNAMVLARLSHPSSSILNEEFSFIRELIESNKDSSFKLVGGFGEILLVLSYALLKGQLLSLALSLVLIGFILSVLFRSITGGSMSILPIAMAILVLFGLMGFLNIRLSTVTSMISSLMIGVGVDYTIHFLWHYRTALQRGMNKNDAVRHTLNTSGKGIVFNALSVIIGFLVLLISNFMPIQFFGFLIITIIFTCLVGALVFLPALCLWIEPKWLKSGNN